MSGSRTFASGSASRLERTEALSVAYPLSMFSWWKPNVYEGSTVLGIGEGADQPTVHYIAMGIDSSAREFLEGAIGGDALAGTGIPLNDTAWQALGGVLVSPTDWRPYLNGVKGSNNNNNYTPDNSGIMNKITLPGLWFDGSYGSHANGKGQFWTFWPGVALTDSEMLALANGVHPLNIRPDKIAFCIEVTGASPELDISGNGRDFTVVNSSTFTADAPTVRAVAEGYAAAVLEDGPKGYWRLGEPSGTNANDEIGSNDGTLATGATFAAAGGLTGDSDTAVDLSGAATSKIAFGSPALTAPFSLECIVWCDGAGAIGATDYGTILGASASRRLLFDTAGANGNVILAQMGGANFFSPNGAIARNAWFHVVYTYDGATERLYINGDLVASQATASGPTWNAAFWAGSYETGSSSNYALNGKVDEIAVYGKVLTADRVHYHRAAMLGLTLADVLPDADLDAGSAPGNWTATPLFSKINDASDATVVSAALV